jgi:hypothetical protein
VGGQGPKGPSVQRARPPRGDGVQANCALSSGGAEPLLCIRPVRGIVPSGRAPRDITDAPSPPVIGRRALRQGGVSSLEATAAPIIRQPLRNLCANPVSINFEESNIQVVATSATAVTDACWAFKREEAGHVVRFLRGAKMVTAAGVFDQFGAALQFPYYFGENWPALSECIWDLSWLPATNYLLVVLDAAELLKGADEEFTKLAGILRDCCEKWPLGFELDQPWARQPATFQVLLQTDAEHSDALTLRLVAADRVRRKS